MPPELRALIDGSRDAVRRVIADLRDRAEQAEQLRAAEHRAFMAEQREALAQLMRKADDRIASVRDGVDGKDGPQGAQGERGLVGERGEVGPQGEPGRDGAMGERGEQGPAGERGETGQAGEQGAPGDRGAQGERGEPGERGETGAQGERGPVGEQGLQGEPGATGDQGPAGERGEAGVPGERGAPGQDGEAGATGRDGIDAYAGMARGLFDPEAAYRAMDVVSFNGCEWRAKCDDPGDLPGDGWMLSASRGKPGGRGEAGREGPQGKDGSAIIAGFVDPASMHLTLTRDDGGEIKVDLYDLADVIRRAS